MPVLPASLKPKKGFAPFVHLGLMLVLPVLLYVLVSNQDFVWIAVLVVLLSKWRMFAVRPRYWMANIRANAVDIAVGLSVVVFMSQANSMAGRFSWAVAYAVWLILIKPRSRPFWVMTQAWIGQVMGLMALFSGWKSAPLIGLVLGCWLICYESARHFFSAYDEPYAPLYALFWGYVAAVLAWILAHWLIFYGFLAQPTLILAVTSFGLMSMYYLEQHDRLSVFWRRQILFVMVTIIGAIIVLTRWGDKIY